MCISVKLVNRIDPFVDVEVCASCSSSTIPSGRGQPRALAGILGGGHLLLWNTAHLRRVSAVRGGGAPESIERGCTLGYVCAFIELEAQIVYSCTRCSVPVKRPEEVRERKAHRCNGDHVIFYDEDCLPGEFFCACNEFPKPSGVLMGVIRQLVIDVCDEEGIGPGRHGEVLGSEGYEGGVPVVCD